MSTVKFRHSAAIAVAGLLALFGAVPVATIEWYLAPILLVPLAVIIWAWRAGTDADQDGVSIRALFGARRVPWTQITGLVPANRRVVAMLAGGGSVALPAVAPSDLPRLVAASGQDLDIADETTADETTPDEEAAAAADVSVAADVSPAADGQPSVAGA